MRATRDFIETKLSDFVIPQGECGTKAFQIASILFHETVDPFSGTRVSSLNDALVIISTALTDDKITIAWVDTGPMRADNQKYRALHCYFVFDNNPLQCFSIWDAAGPVFYDDVVLMGKLVETIGLFGGVELHSVP